MKKIIIIISISLFVISCNTIIGTLAGYKKPKTLSDSEILKYADKLNISEFTQYKIDPKYFLNIHETVKDTSIHKDLLQPLQIIFFDSTRKSSFHIINCYVGGFPKLKWNREGSFDSYPPVYGRLRHPDTVLNLDNLLKYIIPVSENNIVLKDKISGKDVLLVFYNRFSNKNSKVLTKLVKSYSIENPKLEVLFVNTDEFWHKFYN